MFLARIGEIVSIGNHPSMIPKRWRSLELIYSSARIICTRRGWNLNPDGRLTSEKEREREEGRRRLEILQLSKSGFHAYIYIHTYKRDRKRIKHASTWFRRVFYSRVALTHGLIRIILIRDSNLLGRGILPLVRGEREKERECHLKRNTSIRFTCRLPLKYRTFRRNKKLRQYAGLKSGFNLNWFELIILLSSRRIGHRIPAVRYASAPFRTVFPLPSSFPLFLFFFLSLSSRTLIRHQHEKRSAQRAFFTHADRTKFRSGNGPIIQNVRNHANFSGRILIN